MNTITTQCTEMGALRLSLLILACTFFPHACLAEEIQPGTRSGAHAKPTSVGTDESKTVIRTIIRGLEYRRSLLTSASGFFSVRNFLSDASKEQATRLGHAWRLADNGPILNKFFWAMKGSKWRLDQKSLWPTAAKAYRKHSFDGERDYALDVDGQSASIKAAEQGERFGYPIVFLTPDFQKSFLEEVSAERATLVGIDEIGGHRCWEVSCSAERDGYKTVWKHWFVEDFGFAIKESVWMRTKNGSGQCNIFVHDGFNRYAEGIWLPKTVKRESYELSEGKVKLWKHTLVFSVDELNVNNEPDDSLFTLEFPIGANVWDEETNKSWTVGGPVDMRQIQTEGAPLYELKIGEIIK